MKTPPITLAVSLLILSATGATLCAQTGKEGAKPAAPKPAGDAAVIFSGRSKDGNFQEALNDALQKAQVELTKTVADRVAILIDGRFAALGPRDEVLASTEPAVQAFLAGEARVTT